MELAQRGSSCNHDMPAEHPLSKCVFRENHWRDKINCAVDGGWKSACRQKNPSTCSQSTHLRQEPKRSGFVQFLLSSDWSKLPERRKERRNNVKYQKQTQKGWFQQNTPHGKEGAGGGEGTWFSHFYLYVNMPSLHPRMLSCRCTTDGLPPRRNHQESFAKNCPKFLSFFVKIRVDWCRGRRWQHPEHLDKWKFEGGMGIKEKEWYTAERGTGYMKCRTVYFCLRGENTHTTHICFFFRTAVAAISVKCQQRAFYKKTKQNLLRESHRDQAGWDDLWVPPDPITLFTWSLIYGPEGLKVRKPAQNSISC